MTTLKTPVSVESIQSGGRGPTVVVPIKNGQEQNAQRIAISSGADVLPFKVGEDNLLLAGRGLDLKRIEKGMAITYQGKPGTVNDRPLNQRNTFKEGALKPALFVWGTAGAVGGAAAVGAVVVLIKVLSYFMGGGGALTGVGAAVAGTALLGAAAFSGIGALTGGLRAARKNVDLSLFQNPWK